MKRKATLYFVLRLADRSWGWLKCFNTREEAQAYRNAMVVVYKASHMTVLQLDAEGDDNQLRGQWNYKLRAAIAKLDTEVPDGHLG